MIKTPRHRATHPPPAKDGSSSDLTQCASTRQYIQLTSRLRSRRHTRRQSAAKKGSHHPQISAPRISIAPTCQRTLLKARSPRASKSPLRGRVYTMRLSAHHAWPPVFRRITCAQPGNAVCVCVYNAPMFRLICRCLFNKKRNSFA